MRVNFSVLFFVPPEAPHQNKIRYGVKNLTDKHYHVRSAACP